MLYWTRIVPDDAVTPNQMIKDQRLDEDLMPIVLAKLVNPLERPLFQEIVNHGPKTRALWRQYSSLKIKSGLLYTRLEHPSGKEDLKSTQVVLPGKHIGPTIR